MSMGITKQFFLVYDCFTKGDNYLSLADIAAITDLNKSSVHRHVMKLQKAGVISVLKLSQHQYRIVDGCKSNELAQQLESSRPFFSTS